MVEMSDVSTDSRSGSLSVVSILAGYGTAGFCLGLFEYWRCTRIAEESSVAFLVIPLLLLGLAALLIGSLIFVLMRLLSFSTSPYWRSGIAAFAICTAALLTPSPINILVGAGGVLLLLVVITARSAASAFALFLWSLLLVSLTPLFSGSSLDLAFEQKSQTLILVTLTSGLLSLAWLAVIPLYSTARSFTRTGITVLIFILLTFLSSVFLIRLWGFHTLEYLQAVVFTLQILLLGGLLSSWIHYGSFLVRIPRLLMLIITLGFLTSFLFIRTSLQHNALIVLNHAAPHTSLLLSTLRNYSDYDRDGYSGVFGGSDCEDQEPTIHPGARDIPKNSVDENCFGGDLKVVTHDYFGPLPGSIIPPQRNGSTHPRKIAVFVVVDTLRSDYVTPTLTPHLVSFGDQSVRFLKARSISNNTLESFPFLLQTKFDGLRVLPDWTLAAQARKAGVKSVAIFQDSTPLWWGHEVDKILFNFDRIDRPTLQSGMVPTKDVFQRALWHIGQDPTQDLLLFIHLNVLHDSFINLFDGHRVAFSGANLSELLFFLRRDEATSVIEQAYRQEVSRVDQEFGTFWNELQKQEDLGGQLQVLLTSDHGEEFGEHGGYFHMGTLFDEVLRVPLLIYETGQAPREVITPTGNHRVPATILEFFGFSGPHVTASNLLASPLASMENFASFSLQKDMTKRSFALLQDEHKFIYRADLNTRELYDLKNDPHETKNIYHERVHAPKIRDFVERLDRLLFYFSKSSSDG